MAVRHAYRLAIALALIGAAAAAVLLILMAPGLFTRLTSPWADGDGGQTLALIVSALTVIVSTIGTGFSVILGWRHERREADESRLRIKQLEVQLARLTSSEGAPE